MRRNIQIHSILLILILTVSCSPRKGEVFDTYQKNLNKNVSIRIVAYHETGNFGPISGAYYVFEVINKKDDSKINILEFRHDDPIEILTENTVSVDENIFFIWMIQEFVATADGGKTWHVWSVDNSVGSDLRYKWIDNV